MLIRVAGEQDGDFLQHNDVHLAASLLLTKVRNGEILLAEQDGATVGWLRFGYFWDSVPFMNMLFVLERHRGHGIGTALIGFWEKEMRTLGFPLVMTSTLSNESAQHLYRTLGYQDAGGLLLEGEPLELILTKDLV